MGNTEADKYDALWRVEWEAATHFAPSIRTRYRLLARLMRHHGLQGEVLDVGGGNGAFWKSWMDKLESSVTVVDISPEAVKKARAAGLNAVVDDITAPKVIGDRQFDAICCIESLEHIADDRAALSTCSRLLRPDGSLYITVPHSMKYWTASDEFSHRQRRYEMNELREKVRDCNFRVVESFTWGASFYKPYYRFKGNADSTVLLSPHPSRIKQILSWGLFHIFRLEDFVKLVVPSSGVCAYLVARRL